MILLYIFHCLFKQQVLPRTCPHLGFTFAASLALLCACMAADSLFLSCTLPMPLETHVHYTITLAATPPRVRISVPLLRTAM